MNQPIQDTSEQQKEALKFFERDFNQCFNQMRHYDSQILDTLKFMFTAYTALVGIALGFYQFGIEKNMDLSLPALAAITVGLVLGVFMFALTIRNRVYFVQVTRYINEHRGFFLKYNPMGFENQSRMYTNCMQPPYFNWRSSQSCLYYIVSALNATLLGVLLYILYPCVWKVVVGGGIILFILQLVIAIAYLKTREKKSASKAVFGKD